MIYLFDDSHTIHLEPLTPWNAAGELLCGTASLQAVVEKVYNQPVTSMLRTESLTVPAGLHLFINGRLLSPWALPSVLPLEGSVQRVTTQGGLVGARIHLEECTLSGQEVEKRAAELPEQSVEGLTLAEYIWDYLNANEKRLNEDAQYWSFIRLGEVHPTAVLLKEEAISLAAGVVLEPHVVLDARKGAIILDEGVHVGANSVITGPVYIGKHSTINPLTLIRPGCSIGEHCGMGGEVAASIVLNHSNKQHFGYLGRSYVGNWCNLGAGSTTSTLKNTWGKISVKMGNDSIALSQHKLGALIGDHTKLGTGVVLGPGTSVGIHSNLFGQGAFPAYVPPFSWWEGGKERIPYAVDKAIEVTKRIISKYDITLTELQEQRLRGEASRIGE